MDKPENTEPVAKKRGRKPKNVQNTETTVKVPQKRGRKPKKNYSVVQNVTPKLTELNNIILHLPISSSDLNTDFVDKEILKYSPDIFSPEPYDESMGFQPYEGGDSGPCPYSLNSNVEYKNINIEKDKVEDKGKLLGDKDNDNKDNKDNKDNNVNIDTEEDIENVSKNIDKYDILSVNVKNAKDIITKDMGVCCHWCCHTFTNKSIGIPVSYKDGIFATKGVFCSPECACAYNYDSNINSDDMWERYSLLNYMCSKIYKADDTCIKRACSRYTLEMFGGPLTIEQFRKNNINYSSDFKILEPPLISIITQLNEVQISSKVNKFIPIDSDRIKKANDDLKLKRQKPTNEKINTLENCMKLVYS